MVSGWTQSLFLYREATLDRLLRDWLQGTGFLVHRIDPRPIPDDYGGAAPRASFSIRDPQGAEVALLSTTDCELAAANYIDFMLPLLVELRAREIGEIRRLESTGGNKDEIFRPCLSVRLRSEGAAAVQVEAEMLVEQIARMVVDRVDSGKPPERGRISLMRLHGLAGKRRDHVDWDRCECEAGALATKLLEERARGAPPA